MTRSIDRWAQLWCVGGVAPLEGVVEHDSVVVVDDLGLVAELDRLAEAALRDRAGVAVVQGDPAGRPLRGGAGQAPAGLRRDPSGRIQQVSEVVHGSAELSSLAAGGRIA